MTPHAVAGSPHTVSRVVTTTRFARLRRPARPVAPPRTRLTRINPLVAAADRRRAFFFAAARRGRFAAALQRRPFAAEGFDAVAVRFTRSFVADEAVERVTGVGHLHRSVFAFGGPELGGRGAVARLRFAFGDQRRPAFFAFAVASGFGAVVFGELVEGQALGVDEHHADPGDVAERDEGGAVFGVRRRLHRLAVFGRRAGAF